MSAVVPELDARQLRPPQPRVFDSDRFGVAAVVLIVAVGFARLVVGGVRIGLDSAVTFYPAYIYLGDRIRAGEIPFWNPYQFSGMPFVGDLQSGWTYVPAMVLFTILPPPLAIAGWLLAHLALAAIGVYVFARLIGLGPAASIVAVIAYVFNGWFWVRIGCCSVELGIAAWLPIPFIGLEMAMRARDPWHRAAWWVVAGFGVSQMLAVWLGQGAYYALLAFGGYALFRSLISPPEPWPWPVRLRVAVLHAGTICLFGFGLDAVAILPRLEYHELSTLADGYPAWTGVQGGWSVERAATRILGRNSYFAGATTIALAGAGLALGYRRPVIPYLGGLALLALLFALDERSPLHELAYLLLPMFEELQSHLPERTMIVFYLPAALLAGVAVDSLSKCEARGKPRVIALVWVGMLAALTTFLDTRAVSVTLPTVVLLFVTLGVLLTFAFSVRRSPAVLVSPVVAVLIMAELIPVSADIVEGGRRGLLQPQVEIAKYYDATPGARFLQGLQDRSPEPFRYFGYAPGVMRGEADDAVLYRYSFHRRTAAWLMLNNRATILQIGDVQGQDNPLQVRRFAEYLTAMNGREQDYHDANVYSSALASPLLDLLNARYIVVPVKIPPGRFDLEALVQELPTVYQDRQVRILENVDALPRAWIVHEARQVAPGDALPLLANGSVDPRTTALIEESPPPLGRPPAGTGESAAVMTYEPARMVIETSASAAGLLVLSEIYYPSWHAYVDGKRVDVMVANHALRAVPIPAGQHRVELRYESTAFAIGSAISVATLVTCAFVVAFLALRLFSRNRSGTRLAAIASLNRARPQA